MSADLERSWHRLALRVEMLDAQPDVEAQFWPEHINTVRALAEVMSALAAIRGERQPPAPDTV